MLDYMSQESTPARAVRGGRSSAGADVGVRPGRRRPGRRRLRRVGAERHPAAGDPGDEQRVGSLGLAEVNTLRGGDGPERVHRGRRADPRRDRRLTMTDADAGARGDPGAGPRSPPRPPSVASRVPRHRRPGWIAKILLLGARRRAGRRRADHRDRQGGVGLRRGARPSRSSRSTWCTCRAASCR